MGEGLPNVFLFIYVCILFLLANLLFDTKDCIIYFSLPRRVVRLCSNKSSHFAYCKSA